jgi:hypothetical protein
MLDPAGPCCVGTLLRELAATGASCGMTRPRLRQPPFVVYGCLDPL